ncbi:hypothetical protein CHS0354_010487 [Potamilus streckersoni]|uniref:Glycosyltransferase 2-like domain-containing protein n=1 Tax=Potamilus streckersoni TaxID=2493646 RepID=A0AAE0RRR1_9BIVA|nr:hypothetical protein CHS0354_010487 [Potamilus streckersoni]
MRLATRYVFIAVVIFLLFVSLEFIHYSGKTPQLIPDNKRIHGVFRNSSMPKNYETHRFVSEKYTEGHSSNGLKKIITGRQVAKSWKEYQLDPNSITGNPLIDDYGKNDITKGGELGRGITFFGEEKRKAQKLIDQYHINVYASDLIPLNRMVPDSRFPNCSNIPYPKQLPSASVIIPFYDEWTSILLRTIYSLVNRSPRHLLEEIILVDDGSTMKELQGDLDEYLKTHFPNGLIKLIRLPQRFGLIKARMEGWKISTGKVAIFFDSHMEVNIDW